MKVITAIEDYNCLDFCDKVTCFLGGGITDCWEWQDEVIRLLKIESTKVNLDGLVLFNPRRKNFPINDPKQSRKQINWEFDAIGISDIFSMFFAGGTESSQPICFYELGKELGIKYPDFNNLVVTCENNFFRINDVKVQVELMTSNSIKVGSDVKEHVAMIIEKYNDFWK